MAGSLTAVRTLQFHCF